MTQTMFGHDGGLVRTVDGMKPAQRRAVAKSQLILRKHSSREAYCPFCLYHGVESDFMKMNEKSGELYKTLECPECGQKMKMRTLRVTMEGGEEYAEWYWTQIYSFKGYERMSWDKVKERVKVMGISDVFWGVWKEMKMEKERGKVGI